MTDARIDSLFRVQNKSRFFQVSKSLDRVLNKLTSTSFKRIQPSRLRIHVFLPNSGSSWILETGCPKRRTSRNTWIFRLQRIFASFCRIFYGRRGVQNFRSNSIHRSIQIEKTFGRPFQILEQISVFPSKTFEAIRFSERLQKLIMQNFFREKIDLFLSLKP